MLHFFRKNTSPDSYQALGFDFHSHLLPGLDDGAQTIEDSLSLIRQLQELGFSRIVTTPHIYQELYPNTREGILEKLGEVRAALRECGYRSADPADESRAKLAALFLQHSAYAGA